MEIGRVVARVAMVWVSNVPRWHVAWIGWWYAPAKAYPAEANQGCQRVHALIVSGSDRDRGVCAWHDATALTDAERRDLYVKYPVAAAVGWNIEVRSLYGSRSHRGDRTGAGTPLLAVGFRECGLALVAPHYGWEPDRLSGKARRPYRLRTALDMLRLLSADEQQRLFGTLA